MGCGQSSPAAADESGRAAAPRPAGNIADASGSPVSASNHQNVPFGRSRARVAADRSRHHVIPTRAPTSTDRPNQRIRTPSPLPRSPKNTSNRPPPWTRSHLAREREAFFETRVTGDADTWSAVRRACELLRQNAVGDAQAILDAANLTCPTGRVARGRGAARAKGGGVYDVRGALYDLPEWVVTDPLDVVDDTAAEKEPGRTDDGAETDAHHRPGDDDEEDHDDSEDAASKTSRPREEKGKGRAADIGEEISVRARLSDAAADIVVVVGAKQKCAAVVTRLQDSIGPRTVRLAYLGKFLDDARTLEDQGWRRGHVLNAFLFDGEDKKPPARIS